MESNELNSKQQLELKDILDTSLAIDIGVGFTKTSAGIIFRSTVRKVDKHPESLPCKSNVIYHNNLYVVGDSYGDEILSSNKYSIEEYKVCLLTAIALSTRKDKKFKPYINVRLAVGLPAEYYDLLHNELTSAICKISNETINIQDAYCIGNTWCSPIIEEWKTCRIDILDHHIFMQGATLCGEYKKQFKYPLLLLDLGARTLNASLWQRNNNEFELSKFITYEHIDIGFLNIMHNIANLLNCTVDSDGRYGESDVIDILEEDNTHWLNKNVFIDIINRALTPYIGKVASLLLDFDVDNCKDILLLGAEHQQHYALITL